MLKSTWRLLAAIAACAIPPSPFAGAQEAADLSAKELPAHTLALESLDLSRMTQGYGSPQAGKSVDGNPLTLNGVVYPHGVGTHARSEFQIDLKGAAAKFVSMVGVDDERKGKGSVVFLVLVDGKQVASSDVLHGGDAPKRFSVDLTGAKHLTLLVTDADDGIDNDHADWAGARLLLAPRAKATPQAFVLPVAPPPVLASHLKPKLGIHGPRIIGATPGRPFLFLIPATGPGPLTFTAKNLPAGLTLDKDTGILSGSLQNAGTTSVEITVHSGARHRPNFWEQIGFSRRPRATATRTFTIVGGDHPLALTPPMGWNSWNVWAGAVDDAKVRAAADWMVRSGLAAHGFRYINIDDTWEADRDANGNIQSNRKFPDMKALADYVHSKGLMLGIYSSPGPKTCGGYEGSYKHEDQDAATYAKWGIDYLKYDWCSYGDVADGTGLEQLQKPYRVMRAALDKADRDIVFSLCQYGMGDVWTWGAQVGGNCWRTTGDINDSWGSLQGIAFAQDGHEKFAGSGHWNDPDMLVVGRVGWGPNVHPTHLTPNEQITHITMWCLLSAPLLLGCDLSQLDSFTLDLMSNDEVLDINQDPLGKPAGRRARTDTLEVWARPLWDGTTAVGLFNRGAQTAKVTATWGALSLSGSQPVRDLWRQKNLGDFDGSFAAKVPAHGAVLVKIGSPQPEARTVHP